MDIQAVLNNLFKEGPIETWRIHKRNEAFRREYEARQRKIENTEAELLRICEEGPYFEKLDVDAYKQLLASIAEKEDFLQEWDKPRLRAYKKRVKAHYLKDLSPVLYEQWSEKPVQDKVVFIEKNGARTQPNSYLADTIKKQGRYSVSMIGLKYRQKPYLATYENMLKAIKESADAKAIFISSGNSVFSQFDIRPETKLIQLWHGLGIFKKVGYSTLDSANFGMSEEERNEYPQYRNYSYITLPSMEQAWIFEDAMHIPVDSGVYAPIGVSRTDIFFQDEYKERVLAKLHGAVPQTIDKKMILYAPTYRGRTGKAYAPDQMDIEKMRDELSDEYVLLIKHHSFAKETPPIPEGCEDFAFDMRGKRLSTDELLLLADVCITDYSSIAFEFSLMERPLVFFAYDLDEYYDKRGMYYDYEEITPGPVCKTTEEMTEYITHIDERFDRQEIKAFKERFVGACDGHSTERTIALIER